MKLTLFVFALAVLAFVGCKKENKVTPSGYEYVIHTNKGGTKPKPGDYVYFHAQARKADSVVFASRAQGQEPYLQIPKETDPQQPGRMPSPVEEVLNTLGVGDSATVYIKVDTMQQKPPGFENEKVLYYDIVLTSIKSEEQFMKDANAEQEKQNAEREKVLARAPEVTALVAQAVKDYNSGAAAGKIKTTASGLKYTILQEGTGKPAAANQLVQVHYYGVLKDGKMFDGSFERGMPISFPLGTGRVIPGWDEGIALLKEGGKALLYIPAELGYGATGSPPAIPANSELIFYVELEKVN